MKKVENLIRGTATVGLIAGVVGAYMHAGVILDGQSGTGLALIGVGFSLLIAALNQAIALEMKKADCTDHD